MPDPNKRQPTMVTDYKENKHDVGVTKGKQKTLEDIRIRPASE